MRVRIRLFEDWPPTYLQAKSNRPKDSTSFRDTSGLSTLQQEGRETDDASRRVDKFPSACAVAKNLALQGDHAQETQPRKPRRF